MSTVCKDTVFVFVVVVGRRRRVFVVVRRRRRWSSSSCVDLFVVRRRRRRPSSSCVVVVVGRRRVTKGATHPSVLPWTEEILHTRKTYGPGAVLKIMVPISAPPCPQLQC